MRPVSLHHRLKALGIEPDASGWRLWRGSGFGRTYLISMATLLLVVTPALAAVVSLLLAAAGIPVNTFNVAAGVATGLTVGVAGGVLLGVASAAGYGAAFGIAVGVTSGMLKGVAFGAAFGVPFGVAFGVFASVVLCIVDGKPSGTPVGVGVMGVAVGATVGVAVDVTVGVAIGLAFIAAYLRLPLYVVEFPWQLTAYAFQANRGRMTLAWSPALHHELSYLPLPLIARHMVDTARRDPTLVRRALDACAIAPGQRRAGRRALAQLRAQDLTDLARRRAFQSLRDLRGEWLPGAAAADGTFAAMQEVGRYLRSAELTLLPDQQREQILAARDRLHGLDNALLGNRDLESPIYRGAVSEWRRLVDDWLAQTEAAAALVLPNPFRAGDPLDLEFGREVFRGREPLVAELESILGDPNRGASMALIGPRRCGKTSLLKMLPLKLPDAQVVFFDVQANPIDSPAALVAALVRVAQEQARRDRRLTLPDLPEGPPMEALSDWLGRLEALETIGRILICIDEFERWADLFPGDRRALLQFLGLIRATIQHRRRVRILIAGATPLDELEPLWSDHFVNLRSLAIGHLTRPVVLDLLTRPTDSFPADAIPTALAEAVWDRTLGQPYLTQLYGQLIVERLNQEGRRQALVADCAAVEPRLLDQAGPHYLSHIVQAAPESARRVLDALARGETLDLDTLDRPTRRYLRRRSLITESGTLGIPVLGAYLLRED